MDDRCACVAGSLCALQLGWLTTSRCCGVMFPVTNVSGVPISAKCPGHWLLHALQALQTSLSCMLALMARTPCLGFPSQVACMAHFQAEPLAALAAASGAHSHAGGDGDGDNVASRIAIAVRRALAGGGGDALQQHARRCGLFGLTVSDG